MSNLHYRFIFSNLSSSYNSLSALIWDDVLKDLLASRNLSEMEKTLVTKIIGIFYIVCELVELFYLFWCCFYEHCPGLNMVYMFLTNR